MKHKIIVAFKASHLVKYPEVMDVASSNAKRCIALCAKLPALGAEACFISSPANYRYLSGFSGSNAKLLILKDKKYLFTDFRYIIQAAEQAPEYEIVKENPGMELAQVYEALKANGVSSLAFEDAKVSVKAFPEMKDAFPGVELRALGSAVEQLRMRKYEDEVEWLRKAAAMTDEAFAHILGVIKPGVSECDIAAEIEYHFRKRGSRASFEPVAAGGPNSAICHAQPSLRKLQHGDMVLMDFGCEVEGYLSDMTRTVSIGRPSDEMKKIYSLVLEAQSAALAALSAGKKAADVDAAARGRIAKAGYGDKFGHSLGHGVGLEIHEDPRLSPVSEDVLDEGMAVTIEPGIYIEGLGGVRIEDLCIVRKGGYEDLTHSPKELIEI
ncbi:MAG: Xaa-Pro peptidase family protein [Bacillota bacterium]|nr:Xaa-Pro peptidase family protein [Bacillota bacterium]